ncbi:MULTISPECIES: Rieske (2Fe-2S) protein [Nonomuraea]|uniref:Rieske (2Fe-2S) protein n=1 Tax=Nonomuraea mangrovi TaxID=2316207 RepID=A0ABW4T6V2_9ACTN
MTSNQWVEVGTLPDLTRRRRKLVTVGGERIGLFLVDGTVYALRDVCVHKQRSLTKGTILHGRVICPGHQWAFDPRTGRADGQDECQPTYEVRVEDGTVYVDPRPRTPAMEENR